MIIAGADPINFKQTNSNKESAGRRRLSNIDFLPRINLNPMHFSMFALLLPPQQLTNYFEALREPRGSDPFQTAFSEFNVLLLQTETNVTYRRRQQQQQRHD